MRLTVSRVSLAVGAVLLGAALAQAEDLTLVSSVTAGSQPARTSTTYMGGQKIKTTEAQGDTIFDVGTGTMTFVDTSKKQYWTVTPEEMAAMVKAADQMLERMPAFLRNKMGGGDEASLAVEVQKGTKSRTVAGYPTEHWIVTMGTGKQAWTFEQWVAPTLTPPVNFADVQKMRSMATAAGPMAKRFEKLYAEMSKIKGFPLATEATMMGQTTKTEVTEVKKGPIPASTFEVPAGYKQVESPMAQMSKH